MGLFTKDIKTMNDLFVHQLQDIYYAEKQLVKALPKMADKATDKQLKQGFLTHLDETKPTFSVSSRCSRCRAPR
jgi:ferritin-like metal-binding protein YciE